MSGLSIIEKQPRIATVPAEPRQAADKAAKFDEYWATRELCSSDRRANWRTRNARQMLGVAGGRLLDVGCGRGITAEEFQRLGFDVTGVDISPQAVLWTRKRDVRAEVCDLENDDPPDAPYDVILCLEVLQQTTEPIRVLRRLERSLTDDGVMIVSLPNEFHVVRRLRILAGRIDFGGVEDTHVKLYTMTEHRRLIQSAGLLIDDVRHDSIVPSGWHTLHETGNRLAGIWPAGLALSAVYRLRRSNHREDY